MAKKGISTWVKWMIEHHECKKEFVFTHHPESRRSIHAGVCSRMYRERNEDYGCNPDHDGIPHRCCNITGTGINHGIPGLQRPEANYQNKWFNNRPADSSGSS